MSVQGLKKLAAAVEKHKRSTAKGLRVGLFRGGLLLQRESQKIVPVDKDILKPSANTRLEGSGLSSAAVVSYSTEYAVFVHEDLEARHKPGKSAKFLEIPAREKAGAITAAVIDGMESVL